MPIDQICPNDQATVNYPIDQQTPLHPMQAFIVWRDEWTLHVDFLDEDHRCLAALLNHVAADLWRCADAGPSSAASASLMPRLESLGAQMHKHFRREEAIMRETDYPLFFGHKSEHDLLLAEYTVMLRDISSDGLRGLEPSTLEALKEWLIAHTLGDDKALAEYLRGRAAADALTRASLRRRRLAVHDSSGSAQVGPGGISRTECESWC
ncbi:MAG: hemerythrin domain-containing protein [Thiohalocapsa sp.]